MNTSDWSILGEEAVSSASQLLSRRLSYVQSCWVQQDSAYDSNSFPETVRGVRLAKYDFSSFFGSDLQKNCCFLFDFGFTKLTAVSFFLFGFCTVCCLMCMHSTQCFPVYCFITVYASTV